MHGDQGSTVILQVNGGEQQVFADLSLDEAVEVVSRASESIAARMRVANERMRVLEEEVLADPDLTVEYYLLHHAKARTDELLREDLAEIPIEEQMRRIEQYHRYTDIGTAVLYEHDEFKGRYYPFTTAAFPNLKWSPYRFNDITSSVKTFGSTRLYEHTWFRGRICDIVGYPYTEAPSLRPFDFNDMASSLITT